MEGVGCFFLRFAPVAVAIRGCRLDGRIWRARARSRGSRKRRYLGGGWGEKNNLFGLECGEWKRGRGEGRFEDSEFGRYHKFLVGGWDGKLGVNAIRKVVDVG